MRIMNDDTRSGQDVLIWLDGHAGGRTSASNQSDGTSFE